MAMAMSESSPDLRCALDDMADARRELLRVVAPLSSGELARSRPGGWTAARVLQHVIESEHVYAKLLAHQCRRTAPDIDAAEPVDGADAAAQLAAARTAVQAMIDGIDDETLYRLTRIGHEEYSPLSVLQNIASHDKDHLSQVRDVVLTPRTAFEGGERQRPATANVTVRTATEADLPRVNEIYDHYILHTATTFDLEPYTMDERRAWFGRFGAAGSHRLFIADEAGRVVGFAGSHQFRTKAAYDTTVEVTVYCADDARGRGIGAALYGALFDALGGEDLRLAVAGITLPNDASVALHERFGFVRAGVMHDVGRKFDRYWDVQWMEKRLPDE